MSVTSIHTLLENWDESRPLTREEAVEILNLPESESEKLLECAYALRTKYKGKKVSVQLLTNVRSGNCSQNCAYCAQSCESHAPIEKYRRVSDEKLYGDNDLVDEKHLARHRSVVPSDFLQRSRQRCSKMQVWTESITI